MYTCDANKASDIRVFQISGEATVSDYMVVLSVSNIVHCNSLVETLDNELSRFCMEKEILFEDLYEHPRVSGERSSGWIIMDYNAVIVHVMVEDVRTFYNLDNWFEKKAVIFYH